jgi:hypothetical protein
MPADLRICLGCRLHMANRRGLCDWCHRRTRRAVAAGKATWADLERRGLVLPAEPGDYDTDEEEGRGLAADLVGQFVLFGISLIFAGGGLVLWAMSSASAGRVWGMVIFAGGVGFMLLTAVFALAQRRPRE